MHFEGTTLIMGPKKAIQPILDLIGASLDDDLSLVKQILPI